MATTISLTQRRFELMAAEHTALIGDRIRAAREKAGLSQRELADQIPGKADGGQVSKWERGEHRPSDDTLKAIAQALGRDIAWFHSREPDKSHTPDPFAASNGIEDRLAHIERQLETLTQVVRLLASAGLPEVREQATPASKARRGGSRRSAAG